MMHFCLATSSVTENQQGSRGVNKAKLIFTTLFIIVGKIFIPASLSSKMKTKIAFFIKERVQVGGVTWQDFSSEWVLILQLASH